MNMENKMILTGMTVNEIAEVLLEGIKEFLIQTSIEKENEEELLTISETCELLRVNKTTLWKHSKNGRLKKYGIGNRVYYKKNEVLASIISIN